MARSPASKALRTAASSLMHAMTSTPRTKADFTARDRQWAENMRAFRAWQKMQPKKCERPGIVGHYGECLHCDADQGERCK